MATAYQKNISLALPLRVRIRDRVVGTWHNSEWLQPLVTGLAIFVWLIVTLFVLLAVA